MKIIKIVLLLMFLNCNAQETFLKSEIDFSSDNLSKFYSSISSDENQIYFNSNDYYLHAFDKKTGILNWSFYTANKSNFTPKVYKNSVFIEKHISENSNNCIQLNKKTGDTIQTLSINSLQTNPIFKNNIMYCAAISPEIGGAILGYDLDKNKIVANAEGNNWFEIDYNGIMKDTLCKNQALIFVEKIKCVKNYTILTHDEKQLDESFLNKNLKETENVLQKCNEKITILLANDKLLIVGNNKKIKQNVDLTKILLPLDKEHNNYREILKIEEENIWFFYENLLVAYNYKTKKTTQVYDLTQWNVHQILLEVDNSKVWLVSKSDGQLYFLNLDSDKKTNNMQITKGNK